MGFLAEAEFELGPKGWRGLGETMRMQCFAGGAGRTQKEVPLRIRNGNGF